MREDDRLPQDYNHSCKSKKLSSNSVLSKHCCFLGFAAGGHHAKNGGGVDYQCLPLNPQFDYYTMSGGFVSWIHGTEYQTHSYPSSIPSRAFNQNVPCARCYSTKSTVMMVPARRDCPSSWSAEYRGTCKDVENIIKLKYETRFSHNKCLKDRVEEKSRL